MKRLDLDNTQVFQLLGEKRLAQVRAHLQLRPFDQGEYFYFEGQSADYLWIVRSGEARTTRTSTSGRVTMLERFRPGEIFGLAAAMQESVYRENAQSVVRGEAWRVPRRLMATLIEQEPEMGRSLLAIVTDRLQDAHDRLCSFAHDNVPSRLARAVLDETDGERIQMTRRVLGESVGTTVETTIRILRGFEREGWIEGGVGWIRVCDRAALGSIARGEDPDR